MDDDQEFYDPADPSAPQDGGPDPAENREKARDGQENVTQIRGGSPLAERAQTDADDPEEQESLFIVATNAKDVAKGSDVRFGMLVKPSTPVEVRYALTGKSISSVRGGVMDPYATSTLLVLDAVVDNVKPQYIRSKEQEVEKVILYVTLKPRDVQQALSEAGQVMIAEAAKAAAA